MRVLVACEYSGIVRDAFRALGHDAVSCDLLPTERPGPHIVGDVALLLGAMGPRPPLVVAHGVSACGAPGGLIRPPLPGGRRSGMIDIVLDFEMLAAGDRAVVIGAGAAEFTADGAHVIADLWPIDARQPGRTTDPATVAWWAEQEGAAVAAAAQAGHGLTLADAVARLITAALDAARVRLGDLPDDALWRQIRWWAKPAAADLALWLDLLRTYRPELARIFSRCRDCRSLWEAAADATGTTFEEDPPGPGEAHSPAADALRSAVVCARARRALLSFWPD